MTSGLAHVTWSDSRGVVWGHAEVYCAAYAPSGEWKSGYWPSRVYVCPRCGSTWMREEWKHSFQYRSMVDKPWVAIEAPCRWHGGGFLLDHLPLESCDPSILDRELKLYFDLYDHEHNTQLPSLPNFRQPANLAGPEGTPPGPHRHG